MPEASRAVPRRHMRAAVSAAFFANGFVIGSWAPQIPVFAGRLGLSEAILGLFILAFGLGAVAAMPVVGWVIARQGSRRIMIALGLPMALALPLIAWAPGLGLAALAVIFAGVVSGGMDVAMNANAVSVEQRLPTAIMSSCHGFWSLGGLAGAALGGPAIAIFGALSHGLFVGLVTIVLMVFVLRHALDDHEPGAQAVAASPGSPALGEAKSARGALLRAVAIGLFALFAMIPEGAVLDWGAVYLRQELGAEIAASGLAFAAFSLTMAALRFSGDFMRNRFGAVRIARVSSLAAAVGLLVAGLASETSHALIGFAVMGIGIANMVPIAFSAAGNLEGLRPGVALSIVTTFGYSGILLAPSAIGFVAERTGFAAVFLGLSALLLFTFAGAGLVRSADARRIR